MKYPVYKIRLISNIFQTGLVQKTINRGNLFYFHKIIIYFLKYFSLTPKYFSLTEINAERIARKILIFRLYNVN